MNSTFDRPNWLQHIGGEWVSASTDEVLHSYSPATGEAIYTFPHASREDVDRAVTVAHEAFIAGEWSQKPHTERGAVLSRLAELVAENAEELAYLETRDSGKLFSETKSTLAAVPNYYEYFAGLADKIEGRTFPIQQKNMMAYSRREPLGVVAGIVPWNSPNYLTSVKLGPALAAGNAVVLKPSEHATAAIVRLVELTIEAGVPSRTISVVTGGADAGAALARHRLVRRIAFTGGASGARHIVRHSAENLARLSLELGGKSPNIVFKDADLGQAVEGVMAGMVSANGQSCVAGSRVLVQEDIFDDFMEKLIDRTRRIKVGDPYEDESEVGPVATAGQLQRIDEILNETRAEGDAVFSAGVPEGRGWYVPPTVVVEPALVSRAWKEELFGPVVSVRRFSGEEEAIEVANDTDFGLAAGIWTRDIGRGHRVAAAINSGIVWVNAYRVASPIVPFGGRGESGYGMEGGVEGLDSYLTSKSVWINTETPGE